MAPSLQSLPAELLLNIVDNAGPSRLDVFRRLRATCREVNDNTIHYFRYQHLWGVKVHVSPAGLESLRAIAQGPLGFCVDSITLQPGEVAIKEQYNMALGNAPSIVHAWFNNEVPDTLDLSEYRVQGIDKETTEFIFSGKFAELLSCSVANLPNLKNIYFDPPEITLITTDFSRRRLIHLWSTVLKITLSVVLAQTAHLEVVSTSRRFSTPHVLPVTLSVLDSLLCFQNKLHGLKSLGLDFLPDNDFEISLNYIRAITSTLGACKQLTKLRFGFEYVESSMAFFKKLANSLQTLTRIRHLCLQSLHAEQRDLLKFLRKCSSSLATLQLFDIHLTKYPGIDCIIFRFLRRKLHIKALCIHNLSMDHTKIDFSGVQKVTVDTRDDEEDDWIVVYVRNEGYCLREGINIPFQDPAEADYTDYYLKKINNSHEHEPFTE